MKKHSKSGWIVMCPLNKQYKVKKLKIILAVIPCLASINFFLGLVEFCCPHLIIVSRC